MDRRSLQELYVTVRPVSSVDSGRWTVDSGVRLVPKTRHIKGSDFMRAMTHESLKIDASCKVRPM
jgi:hypothetical protein